MYTISEVAKLIGVSTHTLRYYEKENILIANRDTNGNRIYEESHIKWLQFVMKLKQTQMPIAKIREYARLYLEGEHTTEARLQLLEDHRKSIQIQRETLVITEKMLENKIIAYKASLESK
ncbi:MerR family transcriptional regulator [Bacillus wiedmannii]|uniref:MerR family transcriptional regulator n=1 Tax=Bacillus wiedmannii TaxID=1890302 RepID=UPI000BF38947|nr:MerR family transcriptional regulator [Bacillus wiedmannii]PEP18441.1 MerR family transcriptional regulator [Bacillus wiedmannii]PEP93032.1 MerR family transcriptional regulator [Bacillus wiedmannii]PFY77207.1 MerR family transcriptional regulator [Bacillus wiedmannii]PHF07865.1 MerR family transcriptional regulator [Bacillus wiedmannii]PHF92524.1 MerR family transcriptional regulator [Bacillus wiedmannii]